MSNTGPAALTNLSAADTLPSNFNYATGSLKTGSNCATATTAETQGCDDPDPASIFGAAAKVCEDLKIGFVELRQPGPNGTFGATDVPQQDALIRSIYSGPLVLNSDYTAAEAEADVVSGRGDAMKQWTAAHGYSPTSFKGQLEYLWHELNHSESNALGKLRQTSSPYDAGMAFCRYFERPAVISPARGQAAERFYRESLS